MVLLQLVVRVYVVLVRAFRVEDGVRAWEWEWERVVRAARGSRALEPGVLRRPHGTTLAPRPATIIEKQVRQPRDPIHSHQIVQLSVP